MASHDDEGGGYMKEAKLTSYVQEDIKRLLGNRAPVRWELPKGLFLGPMGAGMSNQVVFLPHGDGEAALRVNQRLLECLKTHKENAIQGGKLVFPRLWFDYSQKGYIVLDDPMALAFSDEVREKIAAAIAAQ